MTRLMRVSLTLTASAAALAMAAAATAQETDAQARAQALTQALNGGPSETSTTVRPGRMARDLPARPPQVVTRPARNDPDRTVEDLLGSLEDAPETSESQTVDPAEAETAAEPIAAALGYYVRGATTCGQVWPGQGELAFMTPTAFTLDFGGCEPGEFEQTGLNSWRERQQCQTELGGDAGAYVVDYEMLEPGVLRRTARLQIDGSVEQDDWRFCETADVPEEARFAS